MKPPFHRSRERGFALLVTIVLVAFLVLILVGLATFTRVETQVAGNSQQLAQARQNALMALNIAVGQLQKYAGPDQRVTATAEADRSLAGYPANPKDDAAVATYFATRNRHWTGVWGNANSGALPPSALRLNWLVSGNESAAFTATGAKPPFSAVAGVTFTPDMTTNVASTSNALSALTIGPSNHPAQLLVGANTVGTDFDGDGTADASGFVVAPKVDIDVPASSVPGAGAAGNITVGRFAWWVGDEGVKARVNLADTARAAIADPDQEQDRRIKPPRRSGAELFSGWSDYFAASGSTDIERLVQGAQLSFVLPAASAAQVRSRFHDQTVMSAGVLADVRDGGLKVDFTHLLSLDEGDFKTALDSVFDEVAPGFVSQKGSSTNALVRSGVSVPAYASTWESAAPTWEQLRSFGNLGDAPPRGALSGTEYVPRTQTSSRHGLMPVLTSARLRFGSQVHRVAADDNRVYAHLGVYVTLGNPHPVALAPADYFVTFERPNIRLRAKRPPLPPSTSNTSIGTEQVLLDRLGTSVFRISSQGFAAGESRIFTLRPPAIPSPPPEEAPLLTANSTYDLENTVNPDESLRIELNSGAPETDADSDRGYLLSMDNALGGGPLGVILWGPGTVNGSDRGQIASLLTGGTTNGQGNVIGALVFPTSVAPLWGGGARWRKMAFSNNDPINDPSNPSGGYLVDTNFRAIWQNRIGGVGYPTHPTGYSNVANLFQVGGSSSGMRFVSSGGVDDLTRVIWGPTYNDQSGLVQDPAGQVFRFEGFDVPRGPIREGRGLASLGQLQHFNAAGFMPPGSDGGLDYVFGSFPRPALSFSGEVRAAGNVPGNAIGNSRALATFARNETSNNISATVGHYFDASYLLNEALFDRFFFSTVPQSGVVDPASPAVINERYVPFRPGLAGDAYRQTAKAAAGNLLVEGMFNAHSTSVDAWAALLGGFLGVDYQGTQSADGAPYARSSSVSGGANNADNFRYRNGWSGFRRLSYDVASPLASSNQLRRLAQEIVRQNRLRGPVPSLSNWVNRRLITPAADTEGLGLQGALGAAIDASGVNPAMLSVSANDPGSLPVVSGANVHPDGAQHRWPKGTGFPGWLSQADILMPLAPYLSVRSDTFTIRTYGEAVNPATGEVTGRAWCEAVVQRLPDFVDSTQTADALFSALNSTNQRFGRKFQVLSFRWLNPDDL